MLCAYKSELFSFSKICRTVLSVGSLHSPSPRVLNNHHSQTEAMFCCCPQLQLIRACINGEISGVDSYRWGSCVLVFLRAQFTMPSLNPLNPLSKCRSFWCEVVSCAVTCFPCSAHSQASKPNEKKNIRINTYRCIK